MSSPSTRVLAWQAAWESRNPDKVAALYARDATHASAVLELIEWERERIKSVRVFHF